MKKLVIAGSSKLQERAAYWRGYFEGRGYDVIDFPSTVPSDGDYAENLTDIYTSFYQNIDRADAFFLMNEDKDDIGGYVGPSSFAELSYVIIGNLNRGKKTDINILQMPSSEQACYGEIKFWLDQGWINVYDRPTSKKAALPAEDIIVEKAIETSFDETEESSLAEETNTSESTPSVRPKFFISPRSGEKTINIISCRKRCLNNLSPAHREYLSTLSPEFPAWLLRYIAAPEMQRLDGVSMVNGIEYSSLYNFDHNNTVFAHSIGVALIVWRFTHDKKQTLAALFHDIANPAFKHCIDFMNGDSETQESTEERTSEIIRNSRTIMRQLKRDGILAGEVSDYHLFPLADNAAPNLAADRLEYTLSNGLFLYNTWDIDQVRRFSDNITVLKNENNIDEIGFRDLEIAREFTIKSLPMFEEYRGNNARAIMQFYADIIKSMELHDYLTIDDLYTMNEREIIDWILSCGDKTISNAFREFQRATSVYGSSAQKKDRYCTSVKAKNGRYIVPLVASEDDEGTDQRITELSKTVDHAIKKFIDVKPAKYVGFDFEFTPYTE